MIGRHGRLRQTKEQTVRSPLLPPRDLGLLLVAALGWSLIAGCGGRHDASVSGNVTLDGQPLVGGHLTFHPVGPGAAAYGRTLQDGSYALQTGRETGLEPGEYTVTVVATTAPEPGDEETIGELLTPPRYRDVERSELRYTVNRGSNRIDIELTSAPPSP